MCAAGSRALKVAPRTNRVHVHRTPSLAIGGSVDRPPSTRRTGSFLSGFCPRPLLDHRSDWAHRQDIARSMPENRQGERNAACRCHCVASCRTRAGTSGGDRARSMQTAIAGVAFSGASHPSIGAMHPRRARTQAWWQATERPSGSTRNAGSSLAQRASGEADNNGQRVWKRQPAGGDTGLGGSPASGAAPRRCAGSPLGIEAIRARV
jgi:hypothetical protein